MQRNYFFNSDGDSFASRLLFKISASAKLILKKRICKHYQKNQIEQIPIISKQISVFLRKKFTYRYLTMIKLPSFSLRYSPKNINIYFLVYFFFFYPLKILFNIPVFNYHGQIRVTYNELSPDPYLF